MKTKLKDRAFLIKSIPYSNSSLILKAFGHEHGQLSLLAKGIRSKPQASLLNPLCLYEFSFYEPRESGLCLLAELSLVKEFDFTDRIEVWTAAECALELYSHLLSPRGKRAYFELLRNYLVYLDSLQTNAVLSGGVFASVFRMLGYSCDTQARPSCGGKALKAWIRQRQTVLRRMLERLFDLQTASQPCQLWF